MSALFGYQPEFDVDENQTLYGAIRYDSDRRPLGDIVRKTYFAGLDLVPGNLELHEFEHDTPRVLASGENDGDGLFFMRVASALHSVADSYDVVVIDCPPQLGFLYHVGAVRCYRGPDHGPSADAGRGLDEPVPGHDFATPLGRSR